MISEQRRSSGWYLILFSMLAMLVVGAVAFISYKIEDLRSMLSFNITTESGSQEIRLWREMPGEYYCFLPSYVSGRDITVNVKVGQKITLNGHEVRNGDSLSPIQGDNYEIRYSGRSEHITFMYAENTACMFIDTASGGLDRIHGDKELHEGIALEVYDKNGIISLLDRTFECEMKGRGNYTWSRDKKPYSLILNDKKSVLGMSASDRWVLLSNATDPSNIRNKLIYDFAGKINMAWNPSAEFVDLYINGNYMGLYLLSEKVEIAEDRINIDPDSGVLFSINHRPNWADQDYGTFTPNAGLSVEINYPLLSKNNDEFKAICEKIDSLDAVITSGDETAIFNSIDVYSWIRRYLVDEIFLNWDAEQSSSYFYYDRESNDKTVYAGPIWDYDFSLGNSYEGLGEACPARILSVDRGWSRYLMTLPSYRQRTCEIFKEEYLPLLSELNAGGLDDLIDSTQSSRDMDMVRWYINKETVYKSLDTVRFFVDKRTELLSKIFSQKQEFYIVTFTVSDDISYSFACVSGEPIDSAVFDFLDLGGYDWVNAEDGSKPDFDQPVICDKVFIINDSAD